MSMVIALSVIIAVIALGALLAAHYIVKETRDIILSLEHQVTVQNLFENPKTDTSAARECGLKEPLRVVKYPVKPEPPKPDAAKECGVVPPKFDETAPCIEVNGHGDARNKNRRRGMEKVIVTTRGGYSFRFYNLADFYYCSEARKCDFSPPEKMEEPQRLHHIALEIAKYYRAEGIQLLNVKLFRRGKWHIFRSGVEI